MNVDFSASCSIGIAAVAQDARVAVDVGDGALGGRGVDEALVEGGVAGLGQQRTQRDAVGALGGLDDVQVELATGVVEGGVLVARIRVIGHGNPFVAAVDASKSALQKVVPFQHGHARGGSASWSDGLLGRRDHQPVNSANVASRRATTSSTPSALPVRRLVGEVGERGHDDRRPTPRLPAAAVRSSTSTPIRSASTTSTACRRGTRARPAQRRRRHDDPHDAHHPLGATAPRARRDLVSRTSPRSARRSASKWLRSRRLVRQFDGGLVDGLVDQRQSRSRPWWRSTG